MRYILQVFKMSTEASNARPCLFQTKVYCPLNRFGVLSYVSSSIHNLMLEFPLSCVLWSCKSSLSLDSIKRNQAELGPEISVARLLEHNDQSNYFCNADTSKLYLDYQNVEVFHCAVAWPQLKAAVRSSGSSDNY
jgi:hypothetical protein